MWTKTQTSFNAGELSPYLDQRPDLVKYGSGCSQLENFIVMPYGGVYRRPGTNYVASTKADAQARLIPFNFSTSDSFVLEFGDSYIRFFKGGSQVYSGAAPYEITSPWSTPQLREIQFTQVNDVMFLVHPEVPPYTLSRLSDTSWTLTKWFSDEEDLRDGTTYPPMRDQNVDRDNTIQLGATNGRYADWALATVYAAGETVNFEDVPYVVASAHTSAVSFASDLALGRWRHLGWTGTAFDTVEFVATVPTFGDAVNMVPEGSFMQVSHKRPATSISINLTANTPAGTANTNILSGVFGTYNVRTYGIWSATIQIQRTYDLKVSPAVTDWETVAEFVGKSDRNVDSEDIELRSNAFYRVVVTNRVASTPPGATVPRVVFEVQDQYVDGLVEVIEVLSTTTARVKAYTMIYSVEPTDRWRVGAWNSVNGYPGAVCLHEQRVFTGGSVAEPQTVWGSGIDDFYNYLPGGTEDSDPVTLTIASGEQNSISWLVSRKKLVVGTSGAEWTLGSSDADVAITPSNVVAKRHSSFGSNKLQAIPVNEVVFFSQRNGRKVREFVYSFENDGFVALDMTRLAEHVTAGGIVEWGYQQQRDQTLWGVTGNGELIGFTYERADDVLGWHRHISGIGFFESVAVIYGDTESDEVWVIVKRTINGVERRYVEQLDPYTWIYDKSDATRAQLVYMDCAVQRRTNLRFNAQDLYWGADELVWTASAPGAAVTGLDHLEGQTVSVSTDGARHRDMVVTAGGITLDYEAVDVVVGLPYTSILRSLRLVTPAPAGSSQGRERKVHELMLNFYQTTGGQYTPDGVSYDVIPYRDTADLMDAPPPLYTGDIQVKLHGGWGQDGVWEIRQPYPYPLTLRAVTVKYNASNP